jgi:glutathione S-transferase
LKYRLYYWPGIQGRGEFIRLALEDAGADYEDVLRHSDRYALPKGVLALPYLVAGKTIVSQTANILQFLGPRLRLAPKSKALWVHQLQLTIADWLVEVHDTHHPVGSRLYYEDQKKESKRRAGTFIGERLPKYLDYFERLLGYERGPYLLGRSACYADLSLFQMVAGLRYAFPVAFGRLERRHPRLTTLHCRVALRPRLAAYLASPRRIPFNRQGIFRHYPELDLPRKNQKKHRPVPA